MSERRSELTLTEKKKLGFLLDCYVAVYDAWRHHVDDQHDDFESQADKAGWRFDWSAVIRECHPHVLVVMSGEGRNQQHFPTYAVIPGAGEWFELHSNPERLELLRSSAVANAVEGDGPSPLEELGHMITTLPNERRGEAFKHLNALRRIMKPAR